MDSILEEQPHIRSNVTNENRDLLPLPDHQDEAVGANSMERLMSKEAEGLVDNGKESRNKNNSIATLNNDLQPHNNGFEQNTNINKDIFTPVGGSANQLN